MTSGIPEWEVEDALTWKPELLEESSKISDIKLIQRQKYLPKLGRYIDLLFKSHNKYVLVEVKSTDIKNDRVIHDQILPYKKALVHDFKIPPNQIIPVLAIVGEISDNVKKSFEENGIIVKQIKAEDIIKTKPPKKRILVEDGELQKTYDLLLRRGINIDISDLQGKITIYPMIRSVQTWINEGVHDYLAKEHIASIFKELSLSSPVMAHEVRSNNNGKFGDSIDMWFWLFYSVLDRRANAANFIRAREALEEEDLFHPQQLNDLVKRKGETEALTEIAELLRKKNFPLLVDRSYGDLTNPKSIIDAAKLIDKYDYDFKKIYNSHYKLCSENPQEILQSVWKDIKENIYGVGGRITAQFIRGMVLKGPWTLPLTDNKFLEKCRFNETFAGPLRLNIAENDNYIDDLSTFADEHLEGNRGIISHVLWYIRRRYCHRRPDCMNCKLSGYCRHYLKIQYKDMYSIKKNNKYQNKNQDKKIIFQSKLKMFTD